MGILRFWPFRKYFWKKIIGWNARKSHRLLVVVHGDWPLSMNNRNFGKKYFLGKKGSKIHLKKSQNFNNVRAQRIKIIIFYLRESRVWLVRKSPLKGEGSKSSLRLILRSNICHDNLLFLRCHLNPPRSPREARQHISKEFPWI